MVPPGGVSRARQIMRAHRERQQAAFRRHSGGLSGGHTKAGLDKRVVPEQELNSVVKRVASKWKGADGDAIRPVDTPGQLPQGALDSADEQNMPHDEIKGVFYEGHIYPLARTRPAARECVSYFFELC